MLLVHSNPNEDAKLKANDVVKESVVVSGKVLQEYSMKIRVLIEMIQVSN